MQLLRHTSLFYTCFVYMPLYATTALGLGAAPAFAINVVTMLACMVLTPLVGLAAERAIAARAAVGAAAAAAAIGGPRSDAACWSAPPAAAAAAAAAGGGAGCRASSTRDQVGLWAPSASSLGAQRWLGAPAG